MKSRIFSLFTALILCLIGSISASAQVADHGTFIKKGKDYTITAKFDLRNKTFHTDYPNIYLTDTGEEEGTYKDYYGYVKLESGGHQEGYDIIDYYEGDNAFVLKIVPWQYPVSTFVYPDFSANSVNLDPTGVTEWLNARLTATGATTKKTTTKKATTKKATTRKRR